jgi:hypothetical protein
MASRRRKGGREKSHARPAANLLNAFLDEAVDPQQDEIFLSLVQVPFESCLDMRAGSPH